MLTLDQWLDIGWDYYNAGKIDDAFSTFLETVEAYPDSAEAHLALGEIYIEMGQIDRGRTELLISLNRDDTTPLAARAHYSYALSIREEDPWTALLHLNRALSLGGSQNLQLEIAHLIRFCYLLIQMPQKSISGPIVLHYADYVLSASEGNELARKTEEHLYLVETFCYFDLTEPVHIFMYPSDRARRAEIMLEENDSDPLHREHHVVFSPGLDLTPELCSQVIADLQAEMNRHAGADWVDLAMPFAVKGLVGWSEESAPESPEPPKMIDIDDAVRALQSSGTLVNLPYLLAGEYNPYIPKIIMQAELGSFLRWVRRSYESRIFQELVTQPNVDIVLNADLEQIQAAWLEDIARSPSLLSDPELAMQWAEGVPHSPLSGDAELPSHMLKEGLRLYLSGQKISGLWEIRHALKLDPGYGLAYYTLGWIACNESDWEEAEEQLSMALLLFESPNEIAWCHTLLAPIYLNSRRWSLAQSSLNLVQMYTDSEEMRAWATDSKSRVEHILMLMPAPLDIDAPEYTTANGFFDKWDIAVNSSGGVSSMLSALMDETRAQSIAGFYASLRKEYPTIRFTHEVASVGRSGTAIYIETRIFADFGNARPALSVDLKALTSGGYPFFFQIIPAGQDWQVLDWEDGNFPLGGSMEQIPNLEN